MARASRQEWPIRQEFVFPCQVLTKEKKETKIAKDLQIQEKGRNHLMIKRNIFCMLIAAAFFVSACTAGAPKGVTVAADSPSSPESAAEPKEGEASESGEKEAGAGEEGEKRLRIATSFAYPSLDSHKEYYGWYTSIYGITESLFKLDESSSVVPLLASEVKTEGNLYTITLKENAAFSNGDTLTAQMVIRNLERVSQVNPRFAFLADFTMEAIDEKILSIDTKTAYPTLINDLASPEMGILHLDATTDFDASPVATGPFVVESFIPDMETTVVKNTAYWGGTVKLDRAWFKYMQDDSAKLLAMQNGEIDGYNTVNPAAIDIYKQSPDKYVFTSVPATRLQYYILNQERLSKEVRAAIIMAVDKEYMAAFLNGTVSPTAGPYSSESAYGKVKDIPFNTEEAMKLLEGAGYVKNSQGIYEKDKAPLSVTIAYYPSRSLDTVATLIQEQLRAVGIEGELKSYEDPDSTYIQTRDFDIALYSMIADKGGDPYYFIDSTLREGSYFDVGGFTNEHCEALIHELAHEPDRDRRARLAREIIQMAIDDYAFSYTGLFNKTTVLRKGVSGFSEEIPFDFYGIHAGTDIETE